MFKLSRNRSDRFGERFEFRFSNFRALQVPRGWDRVYLSFIIVETSKTVVKSTKANNLNGTCQWPDSISEFIFITQDEATKQLEECQLKIVLSMGAAKTGSLGEIILNLTEYLRSGDAGTTSFTLQKCSHGTTLQLKIQCLTKNSPRGGKSGQEAHYRDELTNNDDTDQWAAAEDSSNRDVNFSASGSQRSSSGDSTLDRTNFSPKSNLNGGSHMGRQDSSGSFVSNLGPTGSSKDLLEAAEETIEELRDEAKMWERHSRKLKIDLESVKKECSDRSKHQEELEAEVSALSKQCDSLRQEIGELKSSLQGLTSRKAVAAADPHDHNELGDELKFQKESNAELTLQLKKAQEANVDLVSVLQELEKTVEDQKVQLSKLPASSVAQFDKRQNNQNQVEDAEEWARKLSIKEEEIATLKNKLASLGSQSGVTSASNVEYVNLEKENEALKEKIQELEKDCAELTEENLDLIYQMNDAGKDGQGDASNESQVQKLILRIRQLEEELRNNKMLIEKNMAAEKSNETRGLEKKCADLETALHNSESEAADFAKKLLESQEELEEKIIEVSELKSKLESFRYNEEGDNLSNSKGDEALQESLLLKEKEIERLSDHNKELEALIFNIKTEKGRLEESLAASLKEKDDHTALFADIESHVTTNKMLEQKTSELEKHKVKLESQVTLLEQNNMQLSERIVRLEAQLMTLVNDNESNIVELETASSLILNLNDKVEKLQADIEIQKRSSRQKLQKAQKRTLDAENDAEQQKRANYELQSTVESLIEERCSLQMLNTDLKKQKIELYERATHLEMELEEWQSKSFGLTKEVEVLEVNISLLQKDISSKEQTLLSELESILEEHKEHEERIKHVQFMMKKIEAEKTFEVENLEREINELTAQVSLTIGEREQATLEAIHEASTLRTDKAKLEANLLDVTEQITEFETQLDSLRLESKKKMQGLVDQLSTSKQSEASLMAEINNMQRSLEAAKSNEEKYKRMSNELEIKSRSSEYEKQQILEEISGLKNQLQKMALLQEENLKLRSSLDATKCEKGRLEELLKSLSEEGDELKAEKIGEAGADGTDIQKKVRVLESELAKAMEENNMYKARVDSPESGGQDNPGTSASAVVNRPNTDNRILALEADLRDLQERYVNLSMQYAEVEAEREQLVMKLKSFNKNTSSKRWFS